MAESEACVSDLINVLKSYEQGVFDILYDGLDAADEAATERGEALTAHEEKTALNYCAEEDVRVEDAQAKYINELGIEQDNWYKRETDVAKETANLRKYELEIVEKHLSEQGCERVEEALTERCQQHLALLTEGIDANAGENRMAQAEKARQEWTGEVCKAVVMEMRKEWRSGQRKVLQQLAGELRAERKAAGDALERQIMQSKKVSETVKSLWANEIQEAQEELDQVSEAFKKALKMALEARLREARQHCKEQAEFFQQEIRDALLFEQQENALHRSQLRRMRLAMLKWRYDYLADAKKKSAEFAARAILGKLAAAGRDASDAMELNDVADTDGDEESRLKAKEAKKAERLAKKAAEKGDDDEDEEGGDEEEESEDEAEDSGLAVQATEDATDPELDDCRTVVEKLWGRLANGEESALDFLFKLEEAIPYEDDILILYEEELQRHGVVVSLDATDGRAEDALTQERETAAHSNQTKIDEVRRDGRKKKQVKPAVPSVRRRVDLNA